MILRWEKSQQVRVGVTTPTRMSHVPGLPFTADAPQALSLGASHPLPRANQTPDEWSPQGDAGGCSGLQQRAFQLRGQSRKREEEERG